MMADGAGIAHRRDCLLAVFGSGHPAPIERPMAIETFPVSCVGPSGRNGDWPVAHPCGCR